LIAKGDFDANYREKVAAVAKKAGANALHGKELGIRRIETVAGDLLSVLRSSGVHFFLARVEKRYLLATKIFDSLFDSGENAAVAWHHYNIRPLRLTLAFKLASIVEEGIARKFWACILERNEDACRKMLVEVCEALLPNVDNIPDERSRVIFREGLKWARAHPESIQIHVDQKIALQGHFPNMVAFANLLDGLERHSKRFKKPVARITHDKQSEFEKTLATWHSMFSNAAPDEIRWAGETYTLQKVVGSQFEVKEDSESAGIQVIDTVLWLYSQLRKSKPVPPGCLSLLTHVFANGWENDFSFKGVERTLLENYGDRMFGPISAEQESIARAALAEIEKARQKSMAQYQVDKLPPFMRWANSETAKGEAGTAKEIG
jgi:hypothetical protein